MSWMVRLVILLVVPLLATNVAASDPRDGEEGHCDPQQGPAGQTICLYDDASKKLAWFACVSNTYVQTKSKGADHCDDGDSYCPYGCWDEGVLTDNCECPASTDGYMPVDSDIPAWCYDPPGPAMQECMWYRECLDARRPCQDSDNGYAVAYGERFCNLYADSSSAAASTFSRRAVDWIDGARQCLQFALVPLLRHWVDPDCRQVRDVAFASHAGCYLAPGGAAPGLCSLVFGDWMPVFWTMKSNLIYAPAAAALTGLAESAAGCQWEVDLDAQPMRWLRLRLGPATAEDGDASALDIADRIARELGWDGLTRTLDWFCYAASAHSSDLDLLLVDKLTLGLTTAPDAPLVNLTDTVRELIESVEKGPMRLQVGLGNVTLLSVRECESIGCRELLQQEPTGNWPNDNSSSVRWHLSQVVLLVTLTVCAVIKANY